MKKLLLIIVVVTVITSLYFFFISSKKTFIDPIGFPTPTQKPLLSYTFEKLRETKFPQTQIKLDRTYSETADTVSQIFYFETPKKPGDTKMDITSGLMNVPKGSGKYPVIVMFRGYVSEEIYEPGVGTQHVAEALAAHEFITLAPDFLGFGESSAPSKDSFEARFQTYTTALTLLSSLSTLNEGLNASYSGSITADLTKIGIWGHSNGGHIALSVLAISGQAYPTVLWAPVSKSFPYSILYYSDEADDHGKALRVVLANFERDYNADFFSPINYYRWIKAPLSIHQGTTDEAVPEAWSRELVTTLKKEGVDVEYHTYPGDHNMLPSAWSDAVAASIAFFDGNFK